MKTTSAAAIESVRGSRFARRERSSRNGSTNWRKSTAQPTQPQPPRKRARYHEISSVRLPDHTIRYCENVTYAQNIVNANIILPRSCRWRPPRNSETGRVPDRRLTASVASASAPRPCPAMKITPYIVEYQCGSSDMTQSTAVHVVVSAQATSPPPERSCSLRSTARWSALESCSRDQRLSAQAIANQIANASAARKRKNGALRYPAFFWRS